MTKKSERRIIRASEIASYLYCKRAWWYAIKGVRSQNEQELVNGQELHYQHGTTVFVSGLLRLLAYALILLALGLFTVYVARHLV
ncbi:MAG: hypothetical protein DRI56_00560 [Chloroflexota bacterium]|nr:MAG: hypothetical protein DRI56_00560 [Chloroflexota bacterium]